MKNKDKLIEGFRSFQKDYFGKERSLFDKLKQGQNPDIMVIGCSDARVDPAIMTNCSPGEIFTVRNVANLVPPYEKHGGQHGISAALEFAVCHLHVDAIVVLGHSQCGGIKALKEGLHGCKGGGFITRWMSIASPALESLNAGAEGESVSTENLEKEAIALSLGNLKTFPFIKSKLQSGEISLHGWYFDLAKGGLYEYSEPDGAFVPLAE